MTDEKLFSYTPGTQPDAARVTIDPTVKGAAPISPLLFGKFCEHLGSNIYQGMEAEILFNPTMARWAFNAGTDNTNGGMGTGYDAALVQRSALMRAQRFGIPEPQRLVDDYLDGMAFGWYRLGSREQVRVSADVGAHGGRAQRIELLAGPEAGPVGLAQQVYLPLHRTSRFEFRVVGRASAPVTLTLRLGAASADVSLGREWSTVEGSLELDAVADPAALFQFSLTAAGPANIVIDRVLVYPADHVGHCDPDIIAMLRESELPLLRWPGGNFVSGYRWRAGVGPVDARPTLPNPAWESLEYNLFGTDEFVAFCRAVGCEPMICLNAGDGSPEEAADWVEYCNGGAETPMGALRAANGHPEPFGVRLWEIGNELDGRHQVSWTTAGGYADRYGRFCEAMLAVDPTLRILACGSHVEILTEWNTALIEQDAACLNTITHHVLNGGSANERTDAVALYESFMGYAQPLFARYRTLLEQMAAGGVAEPRVAITEMQLFAHFQGPAGIRGALSPATMPSNQTISEAVYLATVLHEGMRFGAGLELVTHSATVNHGGGLRKTHERVWANPVHYGHALLGRLRDCTPVAVRLEAPCYSVAQSFSNGVMPPLEQVSAVDALAALSPDGRRLLVSLVHRSATVGALRVALDTGGLAVAPRASVVTLGGEHWWDENTEREPERIAPRESEIAVAGGRAELDLAPYTYALVEFTLA